METNLLSLLPRAVIPEHSVFFMQALSGGTPFCEDGWLFFTDDDWLMGIGYPFAPAEQTSTDSAPDSDFFTALEKALARTGAASCWIIAPEIPENPRCRVEDSDQYFALDAAAPVPAALRGPISKAEKTLQVTLDREFTAAHRRLWAKFLEQADMKASVRALYARTETILAASRAAQDKASPLPGHALDVRLLSAWEDGHLLASLLLDLSVPTTCGYILGARDRENGSPHATDLLFVRMLELCRAQNRTNIQLGLGVNEGITRFKRKWGGVPTLSYVQAAWEVRPAFRHPEITAAAKAILNAPVGLSKRQIFEALPKQQTFAMVWEARKGEARSLVCGSAHFFCYSFAFSFQKLFAPLHTVIFEGPLDANFLADVEKSGRTPGPGTPTLRAMLHEEDILRLERVVYGPRGFWPKLLGMETPSSVNVRELLDCAQPWFAFFSLWSAFLERRGWDQSVDLEAWRTAKEMGKRVLGMESLAEQLDSLESVPPERIVRFFRSAQKWPDFAARNIRSYLAGDMERMMGTSIEFPTRTRQVINRRDERFHQRMRPFLDAGDCAVFLGCAHLVGLLPMLEQDGFRVRKIYPGTGLKLRAWLRGVSRKRPGQFE